MQSEIEERYLLRSHNPHNEAVVSRLEGKTILRTVVVPGRLVNFVVAVNEDGN